MLERNVGGIDRIVRLAGGGLLFIAGLLLLPGGTLRLVALVAGALGLVTGSVGFCPAYLPFGFSTKRHDAQGPAGQGA